MSWQQKCIHSFPENLAKSSASIFEVDLVKIIFANLVLTNSLSSSNLRWRRHWPERVDETVVDGRSERFRHTRVPAAVDDVTVVTLVLTFDVQSQKETKVQRKTTTCVLSRAATDPKNPDQYDGHQWLTHSWKASSACASSACTDLARTSRYSL